MSVSKHSESEFKEIIAGFVDEELFGVNAGWLEGLYTLTNYDETFRKAFATVSNVGMDVVAEAGLVDDLSERIGFIVNDDGRRALLYAVTDEGKFPVYAIAYVNTDNDEPYVHVPSNGNNFNKLWGTINGREVDNEKMLKRVVGEHELANADDLKKLQEDLKAALEDAHGSSLAESPVDVELMIADFWKAMDATVEVNDKPAVAVVTNVAKLSPNAFETLLESKCTDEGEHTWIDGVRELFANGHFANIDELLHKTGRQVDDVHGISRGGIALAFAYPYDAETSKVGVIIYVNTDNEVCAYVPQNGNIYNKETMTPYGSESANPNYVGEDRDVQAPEPLEKIMLDEFIDAAAPDAYGGHGADSFGISHDVIERAEADAESSELEQLPAIFAQNYVTNGVASAPIEGPAYVIIGSDDGVFKPHTTLVVEKDDVVKSWRFFTSEDANSDDLPTFDESSIAGDVDVLVLVDHGVRGSEFVLVNHVDVDQAVVDEFKTEHNLDGRPTYVCRQA